MLVESVRPPVVLRPPSHLVRGVGGHTVPHGPGIALKCPTQQDEPHPWSRCVGSKIFCDHLRPEAESEHGVTGLDGNLGQRIHCYAIVQAVSRVRNLDAGAQRTHLAATASAYARFRNTPSMSHGSSVYVMASAARARVALTMATFIISAAMTPTTATSLNFITALSASVRAIMWEIAGVWHAIPLAELGRPRNRTDGASACRAPKPHGGWRADAVKRACPSSKLRPSRLASRVN